MDGLVLGNEDEKRQLERRKGRAGVSGAFTGKRRLKFLEGLAYSCNVTAAAAYAGVHHTTVYYHRARDPGFADEWREALSAGYDRLEALVLEHAGAGQVLEGVDPEVAGASGELPAFDFERAMTVLGQYRKVRGGAALTNPGRKPGPPATREETNEALIKAIEGAKKQLAREKKRRG